MITFSQFLAGVLIGTSWLSAVICALDLLIHSPLILFLARNNPKEHVNHYVTAFTIFLFSLVMVLFEPTVETFSLSLMLVFALAVIHSLDQIIFEARRDLPPIEAACHSGQLLSSGLSTGIYIAYVMTLWSEQGGAPHGFIWREFGPWAWTYVPFLAVTTLGLISHGVEMALASRGPKKINERWQWSLGRVLRSPIYWLPEQEETGNARKSANG